MSVDTVKVAAERRIPLLGVCLGMQSMGTAYGASIVRAPTLVHGEASEIVHDGTGLLEGMPETFPAARYHSLMVDPATLPPDLYVSATSPEDGVVMGLRHRSLPIEGVQFHPESVLTPDGPHLLANFLRLAGEGDAGRLDAETGSFATRGMAEAGDEPAEPAPGPAKAAGGIRVVSELVRAAVAAIVDGRSLSQEDARLAMGAVMDGEATPSQLAALLMGLRMRGETVDELAGFATAMRERVTAVEAPAGTIDVVGTGGDGSGTFNISTTAALVVAAMGIPVAKHGNRAITSKSGSADVLDALGIRIDHDAASAGRSLAEHEFAFLFAPAFHPAMRFAGPTRREIGVRTAFNLIGPLTNPAGATRALIGVGVAEAAPRIAEVAQRLGTERTFVVHGDGVDELPLDDTGVLYHVGPEGIERHEIEATKLGFRRAATPKLAGGTAEENARMVEAVLHGESGARRDVVLLNAAAALLVAGAVGQMEEGIDQAALAIDAGVGMELLGKLRAERREADAAKAAAEAAQASPA